MEGFNGFPFFNNSSSSFSTGSSPTDPKTEEATMKKIVEAVELLEKLAKNGEFPQEKLQEIKQELTKKFPNLSFSTQNDSKKPENTNHSQNSSTLPNSLPNDPFFAANFINQLNQQQQLNNAIFHQTQMVNNQFMEQQMRMLGVPWTYTPPTYSAPSNPYFGGAFPSYHSTIPSINYAQMGGDPMKMVLEMMGNMNTQGTTTNAAFSSSAGIGGDGSSATATALSFLASLLSGSGL